MENVILGFFVCGALTVVPVLGLALVLIMQTMSASKDAKTIAGIPPEPKGGVHKGRVVVEGTLTAGDRVSAPLSGPVLAYTFTLDEKQLRGTKARSVTVIEDSASAPLKLVSENATYDIPAPPSDLMEEGESGSSGPLDGKLPQKVRDVIEQRYKKDVKAWFTGGERGRSWKEMVLREKAVTIYGLATPELDRVSLRPIRVFSGSRTELEEDLASSGNMASTIIMVIVMAAVLIPCGGCCGSFLTFIGKI